MMNAYLAGNLSPEEQYQVERYLQDHPFEAEAMEGYEQMPHAFDDLELLENKLHERANNEEKNIVVPLWKKSLPYAAVISLLILASLGLMYYLNQTQLGETLALEEKTEESSTGSESNEALENEKLDKPEGPEFIVEDINTAKKLETKKKVSTESKAEELLALQRTVPDKISNDEEALEEIVFDELPSESLAVAPMAIAKSETAQAKSGATIDPGQTEIALRAKKMSTEKELLTDVMLVYTGKVVDANDNSPLPGVNVFILHSNQGVVTDMEGSFRIEARPGDILKIQFIGMLSEEITLGKDQNIQVSLKSDIQSLSEIVVVGYGSFEEQNEDRSYQAARPVGGMNALKKHIQENMVYPTEGGLDKKGQVVLKVAIDENGKITQIEVVRSLGKAYDEEAKRLILSGPPWIAAQRGNQSISSHKKVSIRFRP